MYSPKSGNTIRRWFIIGIKGHFPLLRISRLAFLHKTYACFTNVSPGAFRSLAPRPLFIRGICVDYAFHYVALFYSLFPWRKPSRPPLFVV